MILANWEVSKAIGGEVAKDPKSTTYGEGLKNDGWAPGQRSQTGVHVLLSSVPGAGDWGCASYGGWGLD